MEKGGSAADAAIVAMLCEGVLSPHTTGIGGGFIATMYNKTNNKVETLIARDVAPIKSNETMFVGKNVTGGPAVAVPGEIMGYWELHQKYGKLNWSQLFEPIIKLARDGYPVSHFLEDNIKYNESRVNESKTLMELFYVKEGNTSRPYRENETMTRPKLAETLEKISKDGAKSMYSRNGTVAQMLVKDIEEVNGIITLDDLAEYRVRWEDPISLPLKGGRTLYTVSTPGSGALLVFILNVLKDHLSKGESAESLHHIAEACKFAYAARGKLADYKYTNVSEELKMSVSETLKNLTSQHFADYVWDLINSSDHTSNDPSYYGAESYVPPDSGTANMNVIAPNGDAIAVTATINTL